MKLHEKVLAAIEAVVGAGNATVIDFDLALAVAAAQRSVDAETCLNNIAHGVLAARAVGGMSAVKCAESYNVGCLACAAAIRKGE